MDIETAYWIIPVQQKDKPLLGVKWNGAIFFDQCLPFGLRSGPKIFTAVVNALLWVFQQMGVSWVDHYLDDFVTVGAPRSQECQVNKDTMLASCVQLGVMVVPEKCSNPSPTMVFLGLNWIQSKWQSGCQKRSFSAFGHPCGSIGREEGMHEERSGVIAWLFATCSHGSPSWVHIH